MREFVEAQSYVQKQKVQLKFEGMQLKEAVSFHWATLAGTPLYGLYRYVPRIRVWFLRLTLLLLCSWCGP